MVSKEEIKDLAKLARMKITDEEVENLTKELDSILEYVGQIKDLSAERGDIKPALRNVMREDVPENKDGEFTEDILNNAPAREGKYLKVKKIL